MKHKSYLDLDFYIETHCDYGRCGDYRPSGVNLTTAHVWAFVIGDSGISVIVPIEHLRAMLDDPSTRDREQVAGKYPTRGKLVNLAALLWRYKRRVEQSANGKKNGRP